jgi:hypothetical protein
MRSQPLRGAPAYSRPVAAPPIPPAALRSHPLHSRPLAPQPFGGSLGSQSLHGSALRSHPMHSRPLHSQPLDDGLRNSQAVPVVRTHSRNLAPPPRPPSAIRPGAPRLHVPPAAIETSDSAVGPRPSQDMAVGIIVHQPTLSAHEITERIMRDELEQPPRRSRRALWVGAGLLLVGSLSPLAVQFLNSKGIGRRSAVIASQEQPSTRFAMAAARAEKAQQAAALSPLAPAPVVPAPSPESAKDASTLEQTAERADPPPAEDTLPSGLEAPAELEPQQEAKPAARKPSARSPVRTVEAPVAASAAASEERTSKSADSSASERNPYLR